MESELIDSEALILTAIGAIPFVGDVIKDQLAARLNARELDNIHVALDSINERIRKIQNKDQFVRRIRENIEFIESALNKIRREESELKRYAMTAILNDSIEFEFDRNQIDWLLNRIQALSLAAIDVLHKIGSTNSTPGYQHHSHASILSELEQKYGYGYLLALLKELDSIGLINLQIDNSSKVGRNSRFVIFWNEISNDIIKYLKK